jgi:hypothetical protein
VIFQPRSGRGTRQHARYDQQHRSCIVGATDPVPGALQDGHGPVAVRRAHRLSESRVLGVQQQSDKYDRNGSVARGLHSLFSLNCIRHHYTECLRNSLSWTGKKKRT